MIEYGIRQLGCGLVFTAFLASSGIAEAQGLTGQWGCHYAYAEYTQRGYLRGHTRDFNIALYQNGGFEAAGRISSAAGVSAFQAQGTWQYSPQTNEVWARGMSVGQSGAQVRFEVGGKVAPGGRMFQSRTEARDSTGRYVAQRLIIQCQR